MSYFVIKQGSTYPSLLYQIKVDGEVYDLTDVQVIVLKITKRNDRNSVVLETSGVQFVDVENGIIKYDWASGDTDNFGEYQFEFRLIFETGLSFVVPDNRYEYLTIYPALGFDDLGIYEFLDVGANVSAGLNDNAETNENLNVQSIIEIGLEDEVT